MGAILEALSRFYDRDQGLLFVLLGVDLRHVDLRVAKDSTLLTPQG
jgi:hypothetical protein